MTSRRRAPDASRRGRASTRPGRGPTADRGPAPDPDPARALATLEALRSRFGRSAAAAKLAALVTLEGAALPRARDVLRLHDALCFLRAYPDRTALLRRVVRMLNAFASRGDLARHRDALAGSGIAGTAITFRFFWPTARWLAERWGRRLAIVWDEFEERDRLAGLLPLMTLDAEIPALDEIDYPPRRWLARLKGGAESDAEFLVRRFAALPMSEPAREILYDQLDPPLRIAPGPDTPSRTRAWHSGARPVFQRRSFARQRPDLPAALRRPVAVRPVPRREAEILIDLAREAMVTRERDLDAFSWVDPGDVRMVDAGQGLRFACMGAIPERRLLLESVYGMLTLRNGVPIGYVLTGSLYQSSEIAYNVFETWRGAEAAAVYARVLAMARTLFGADAFVVPPYQLGEGNDEALDSGAWWFYRKLGFAPREVAARRLARREEERMRRSPGHRSSRATLARLARASLFLDAGAKRDDVMGVVPLASAGLAVQDFLADRFGSDRERAAAVCGADAAALLGASPDGSWSRGERLAWERWSPLVLVLPGVRRWSAAERRALVAVIRAKGGPRESEFVARFDGHRRLREAVRRLARAADAAG
jgi:hypothetical protein